MLGRPPYHAKRKNHWGHAGLYLAFAKNNYSMSRIPRSVWAQHSGMGMRHRTQAEEKGVGAKSTRELATPFLIAFSQHSKGNGNKNCHPCGGLPAKAGRAVK